MPSKPRDYYVLSFGFLFGLILRYYMLFYKGMLDMDAYYAWGEAAFNSGLANSFHGIYFPLQYQIFELCFWLTSVLKVDFFRIFKISNLVFDTGNFCLLLVLLKRERLSPLYALIYWLHPWFLSVFSLGYIDFHFTFLVLGCLTLLRDHRFQDFVLAGIPLGIAFLMKPQVQILLVAAAFYGLFHLKRKQNAAPFGIFLFPMILFVVYEIYFTVSLFPNFGIRAMTILPLYYLNVSTVMPCLTADMTNIWYPIAYFLKSHDDPIHIISDQTCLVPYIPTIDLAAGVALALIIYYIWIAEKGYPKSTSAYIWIFTFASITIPFVMTSAHENHLFLGSVLLVPFFAAPFPTASKIAAHIILLIQFLNIYGLYGEYPASVAQFLSSIYSQQSALAYSIIAIICFVVVIIAFIRKARHGDSIKGQNEIKEPASIHSLH